MWMQDTWWSGQEKSETTAFTQKGGAQEAQVTHRSWINWSHLYCVFFHSLTVRNFPSLTSNVYKVSGTFTPPTKNKWEEKWFLYDSSICQLCIAIKWLLHCVVRRHKSCLLYVWNASFCLFTGNWNQLVWSQEAKLAVGDEEISGFFNFMSP